jgi:hypothetical protein
VVNSPMDDDIIKEPLCVLCLHTTGFDYGYCWAFPGGIPEEILAGEFDHTKQYSKEPWPEGDGEYQFEPWASK